MTGLEKFTRFNRKLSTGIEWVGLVAFIFMMVVTTADVIGAKLFLSPVFGALDTMMLAQLIAITFSAAAALIMGRHVQVEFFYVLLPKRLKGVVDIVVFFICFLFFALIVWRLILYGYDLQIEGEISSTARIPFYPFVYGAAFASVAVCLVYFGFLMEAVLRVLKNES